MAITHLAYSDDSGGAKQRYQSLSLITLSSGSAKDFLDEIQSLLKESNISEFKWQELRSARYRFASKKIIDFVFKHLKDIRVDTLIWDHRDKRHDMQGRDENENRVRMYYHLVSTTLSKRWPIPSNRWEWRPDEQSAVDWKTLWDCLRLKKHVCTQDLFGENPDFERVILDHPIPSESHLHTYIQLADLFAGIGAFSWEYFDRYQTWLDQQALAQQSSLFGDHSSTSVVFTTAEKERFWTMQYLREHCGKNKLQISLTSTRGFLSNNPESPLNFWLYRSRFSGDKAPIK